MATSIGEQDLRDIITGAAFMGAGGGGSPKDGLKLLDELISLQKSAVILIDPQEMADSEWAVMVAEIGAPKVFAAVKSFPETVTAFNVMRDLAAQSSRSIDYLMAGELGGFNTMVSLYVAALRDIPFVDADGNGRAVPQMGADLYAAAGVAHSPIVMASSSGDSVIINLEDPHDHLAAESIARHVCMAYGQKAAFCTFVVNRETIADRLAPGTMTRCLKIGEAFRRANSLDDLARDLEMQVDARLLFEGSISHLELKSEGGFDHGITRISGSGSFDGDTASLSFKNENMLMRDDTGAVIATVPDVITLVEAEDLRPLTNADTEAGQKVAVFGVTAVRNWFRNPKGVANWKPILAKLGYDGPYVPVK
jgi:DUF917 family protein